MREPGPEGFPAGRKRGAPATTHAPRAPLHLTLNESRSTSLEE